MILDANQGVENVTALEWLAVRPVCRTYTFPALIAYINNGELSKAYVASETSLKCNYGTCADIPTPSRGEVGVSAGSSHRSKLAVVGL